MAELNKFQQWAGKRRPKITEDVKPEPELTPEEELKIAWEDWKYEFRIPIFIFKTLLWFIFIVVFIWALAVVSIQNDCYLDKRCREWISK